MIGYEDLPLEKDVIEELESLSIDYVFQPIYLADGKTVYAREALMRPSDMSVTELIEKYTQSDKLHILELATFFGAMKEYVSRGYTEHVSINSFPSECFTPEETRIFSERYGDPSDVGIVEILEYPRESEAMLDIENEEALEQRFSVALDDFGAGFNDMSMVDKYMPQIVKINRDLISGIDHLPDKQENLSNLISEFHSRGITVVAEGIEEKEEFDFLVGLGVDLYQGYYLARPA